MRCSVRGQWGPIAVWVIAGLVLVTGGALAADQRNIRHGSIIPDESYADQPYVVTNARGEWVVMLTTGSGREGDAGQHVVSAISADRGQTWKHLTAIEPAGGHGEESSWVVPLFVPDVGAQGRLYAIYTWNGDRVRAIPGRTNRVDTLGWMVFRYSDDGGRTWSPRRYRIALPQMDIDRANAFKALPPDHPDRDTQMFWSVCKPIVHDGSVYFAYTKIGDWRAGPTDTEGWVLRSDNILTEADPERIVWRHLPEASSSGIRAPELDDRYNIQAEHIVTPLSDPDSLYMVYRTNIGVVAESYSRDRGRTWSKPVAARYGDGRAIKNSRANVKAWRARDGRYLLWYHNHGKTSDAGFDGRDVAWLSGGVERDGRIVWGQPEIVLYDPDPATRFSYPDLIEADGRFWLTETNKHEARVHEISPRLIEALFAQPTLRRVAREGLRVSLDEAAIRDRCERGEAIEVGQLVSLAEGGGFTVELGIELEAAQAGRVILDARDDAGRGWVVMTGPADSLVLVLDDGENRLEWASDPGTAPAGREARVAFIVDGAADVVSVVTDGRLNDGGFAPEHRPYGWRRLPTSLGEVGGRGRVMIGRDFGGRLTGLRIHDRYLLTTEAVGQSRMPFRVQGAARGAAR